MKIGEFKQDMYGKLSGRIYGLGLGVVHAALEPETSKEGRSYFKVVADAYGDSYEIGRAFEKQKDGRIYHSVSLDSPIFKEPLNTALFPNKEQDGAFNLVWVRQEQPKPALQANAETEQKQNRRSVSASVTP